MEEPWRGGNRQPTLFCEFQGTVQQLENGDLRVAPSNRLGVGRLVLSAKRSTVKRRNSCSTANHKSPILQHYRYYQLYGSLSPPQVTGKHYMFITTFPQGSDTKEDKDKCKNIDGNSTTTL